MGKEITLDEPSQSALLAALKELVVGKDINDKLKKNLLKKIENLEKKIEKRIEPNVPLSVAWAYRLPR